MPGTSQLPRVLSESAQLSFRVPTLTCTKQQKDHELTIWQWIAISGGAYVGSQVQAVCASGVASYSAAGWTYGVATGPGSCPEGQGAIAVSPGDSLALSENAEGGDSDPVTVNITDSNSDQGVYCQASGDFPPGPVYTIICSQAVAMDVRPVTDTAAGPPDCNKASTNNPRFSQITFRHATVDGEPLGSWSPTQHNMVAGKSKALQIQTSALGAKGQSFSFSFVS
jgi:hypothetical protein